MNSLSARSHGAAFPGATDDPYPSRVGGKTRVLERADPVVHAPAGRRDGVLDADALAGFEREGFAFLEGHLAESEVESLLVELENEIASRRDDSSPELVREPNNDEIRSIFHVHRTHPAFARLVTDARLRGIAEQILGSSVYVHQSRVNLKPGFDGREFYWHSDFETWHVEDGMPRMRAISVSINLTDNHPVNGPVMVIPGSHRYYVSCAGTTPPDHHLASLRKQEYGVPDRERLSWLVERGGIQAPTGPAGSVLVFDCNVMHGSNGNITPFPRSNVFLVYNSVENALVEPFSGQPPRPEHVASRDSTPVDTD